MDPTIWLDEIRPAMIIKTDHRYLKKIELDHLIIRSVKMSVTADMVR